MYSKLSRAWAHLSKVFVLLAAIASGPLMASTVNQKLLVCASPSWIPYSWETKDGLNGTMVEVFEEFLDQAGLSAEYVKVGSWARCLKQVESGEIDVLLGAYLTPERQQWGNYSLPVAFDNTKVFYLNPSLNLTEFNQLSDLIGAGRIGSSYGYEMDHFFLQQEMREKLILSTTDEAMIQLVEKGRAHYFAGVDSNIQTLFRKLKYQGNLPADSKLNVMNRVFSVNSLHVVFGKKTHQSQTLTRQFNSFFKAHFSQSRIESLKQVYLRRYSAQIE